MCSPGESHMTNLLVMSRIGVMHIPESLLGMYSFNIASTNIVIKGQPVAVFP